MSGVHPSTRLHETKLALVSAARVALVDALDPVGNPPDISFGFRWPVTSLDWFAVDGVDADVSAADIQPRRGVIESIRLSVSVGAWRPGVGEDAEIEASAAAFDMLRRVQEHVRIHDVTLGGTVLWCLPGGASTAGATDVRDIGEGRLCEIAAEFIAEHRIN